MKLPVLFLATAAVAALAACSETKSVANQFENTQNALTNTAETIKSDTENAISETENALDENAREWQNKSLEVNVSIANNQ